MKTKTTINYLGLIAAILSISSWQSCTEKIDIELDSSDIRCVIYGEITTDTMAHKVKITRSADYFSNQPADPIRGATVTITNGTEIFQLNESSTEPGCYFTSPDVYGTPGDTYTINVSNVDLLGNGNLTSYTASSKLNPVEKLDSIDAKYNNFGFWEVLIWAKEPAETEDYYMFKLHINDVLYTDSLSNLVIQDDILINGSYVNGASAFYLFEKDTLKPGDRLTVEICNINKDFYHFIYEAQLMSSPQVPIFSGPPANVRTNFNNGAIGYFAAYSTARTIGFVRPQK